MKKLINLFLIAIIITTLYLPVVHAAPENAPVSEPVYLPILMYHQISGDKSRLSRYVISVDEFESDLRLFKEHGYTTITVKDLVDYTQGKAKLPEKPIMLTFDDGYESDYVYALPLLKKYDSKAVFSIIGKYADEYSQDVTKHISYSHLSWPQIKEMHESGLAEFQSHTYDMHSTGRRRGALRRKDESASAYETALGKDLESLKEKYEQNAGTTPLAFACPFGYCSDSLRQAVKNSGYSAMLTSYEKINQLTGDPEELFYLCRYVRPHRMNVNTMLVSWEDMAKSCNSASTR